MSLVIKNVTYKIMQQMSPEVLTAVSRTIRVFWEVTGVFRPEDDGTTILHNVGNSSSNDTA